MKSLDTAFQRLDEAVGQKQNYETKQIKSLFHGEEGRADMKATVALTEKRARRWLLRSAKPEFR